MKKIFLVMMLVTVATSGCVPTQIAGSDRPGYTIFLQRGVMVSASNECSPDGVLIEPGRGVVRSLAYDETENVPLMPPIFSGAQMVQLTFKGYGYTATGQRVLLGSVTKDFHIRQDGTYSVSWTIGRDDYIRDRNYQNGCQK